MASKAYTNLSLAFGALQKNQTRDLKVSNYLTKSYLLPNTWFPQDRIMAVYHPTHIPKRDMTKVGLFVGFVFGKGRC